MASGWGCQYSTIKDGKADWCRKLKHKCSPGCKGCIIVQCTFAQPEFLSINNEESKKIKNRSDNPLGDR
jgi:hypothetical protein